MRNDWLTHSYPTTHIACSGIAYSVFNKGRSLSEMKDKEITSPSNSYLKNYAKAYT